MKDTEFKHTLEVLEEYANKIIDLYREKLTANGNGRGELYKSIKFNGIKRIGSEFQLNIDVVEYFKWYENGRKAGKRPPFDKIFSWVKRKNIIPRPYNLSNGKQVIPTQKTLAFLIARSIGLKGTKPHPLMKDTLKELRNDMIEDLKFAIYQDFELELSMSE